MGISFEEKTFYDILVRVRDDHGFPYADEKYLLLAKKIKELVDDKAKFADCPTRDDIKNQLNMELTVLLYQNGYPPEWDVEVFEKVMEQAENFKKYNGGGRSLLLFEIPCVQPLLALCARGEFLCKKTPSISRDFIVVGIFYVLEYLKCTKQKIRKENLS